MCNWWVGENELPVQLDEPDIIALRGRVRPNSLNSFHQRRHRNEPLRDCRTMGRDRSQYRKSHRLHEARHTRNDHCGAVMDRHDLEFDSDEGLEAILRRELIEIVRANGLSDPKTLRSVLINLSPSQSEQ